MSESSTTHELQSVFLVRAEHLNHVGNLFGGDLMAEIDTLGYCLVTREFKDLTFVTRSATIDFTSPASIGDILNFSARVSSVGVTSVTVSVTGSVNDRTICEAKIIYVNIDRQGQKSPLPQPVN